MASEYIHGFSQQEQSRLSRMQEIINQRQIALMELGGVQRVLDIGSGLGQMTRLIGRSLESPVQVLGIEKSEQQIEQALSLARLQEQTSLVEFRQGDVHQLPLAETEVGSFDLVHARFILEHVTDPLKVVSEMARAVRPGGKVFILDDDHDLLRVFPDCLLLEKGWQLYWESYHEFGCDPLIGRKLPHLLGQAGISIEKVTTLFYGAHKNEPLFDVAVDNLLGVIGGASETLIASGRLDRAQLVEIEKATDDWRQNPHATLWYSLPVAIGVKPVSG